MNVYLLLLASFLSVFPYPNGSFVMESRTAATNVDVASGRLLVHSLRWATAEALCEQEA